MTVNWQVTTRRSLTHILTSAVLATLYIAGTVGISSVGLTAASAPAHAKKKSGGGRGGGGRGSSRGRRGRRGRGGGCSVVLRVLDVC